MTEAGRGAARVVARRDVLRFRFHQHQLGRQPGIATGPTDVGLLDYGVQDTGPDGAAWALAIRGVPSAGPNDLALAWTLRGAPHAYRRADLAAAVVATAPLSETDAARRILDAAKPLKDAGPAGRRAPPAGYRQDTDGQRGRVRPPHRDGGRALPSLLSPVRHHACVRRIPGLPPPLYRNLGGEADDRFDVIRNYLRFYGPARVRDVATFLDAPVKDVKAHWPVDAVELVVGDAPPVGRAEPRFILAGDLDAATAPGSEGPVRGLSLVGPYDPYLQLRDRELLVAYEARRKDLWPVLGRPGAIVADGEIVGTWRPRASGKRLTIRIEPWAALDARDRAAVNEQAEVLAAHRGAVLAAVTEE